MSIVAFNGYPHSVSILRATGIERIVTYHPTKKPVPDMTYLDEFIDPPCPGIYLKWLNKKSGYDYWLFNPQYETLITTRARGRILSSDTNRAFAKSATHNIGTEATVKMRLTTTVKKDMRTILEYVLISPEVYMFNPQSVLGEVSCAEFVKVFVEPGTYVLEKGRANGVKLRFQMEFDEKNVQSII